MYEVHYYTAGTRSYGAMVIDVMKMEINRTFGGEDPDILKKMQHLLSHEQLIGRDDQERFEAISQEEKIR